MTILINAIASISLLFSILFLIGCGMNWQKAVLLQNKDFAKAGNLTLFLGLVLLAFSGVLFHG